MSLLSFLYPRIRGSQEDVATLALSYILNQSEILAKKFSAIICDTLDLPPLEKKIFYRTQQSGSSRERPDLSGYDSEGHELFVCEEKFYAGLTANQPSGYLDRISRNGGLGLIFICPESRLTGLYRQLFDLCPNAKSIDSKHFLTETGIPVGLVSWMGLLATLRSVAEANAQNMIADIDQLSDFCRLIDSDVYPPFTPEDFGPDVSKKIERYQVIINLIAEKMLADKTRNASTTGLRSTPYSNGYTKYIRSNNLCFTLQFTRSLWRQPGIADSPFWFSCKPEWGINNLPFMEQLPVEEYRKYYEGDNMLIALIPKPYLTMDETAADLLAQIDHLISFIDIKKADDPAQ